MELNVFWASNFFIYKFSFSVLKTSNMTTVMFLLCACLSIVSSLDRRHDSRSSLLHLIDGKILIGYELRHQRSFDLMACARSCLSLSGCVSFNYEKQVEGNCELKNKRADTTGIGEKLIPSPGFIFGQLMNTSVSFQ